MSHVPTTYIYLPPLRKPTGGMAVLHQIAGYLHGAGVPVVLVPRDEDFWRPETSCDVPVTLWADLELNREDLWLVPEGWVNALTPGLQAGARCVVYVQNWAYLFSALPEGVTWDRLPVSFIAVSEPVEWFMRQSLGVKSPVLRPGIDLTRFCPPQEPLAPSPVRIAYMPRKNKALAAQIKAMFQSRSVRNPDLPSVEWVPIEGQSQQGVAELLRGSHIFLAAGYPEGCPLPPLEAMASGCVVVGYAGLGGFDYMRQAVDCPGAARPWCGLRDVPWGGNGMYAADADVAAVVMGLEQVVSWIPGNPLYGATAEAALQTASAYGEDRQRKATLDLWDALVG